jgi:hypothetical protein
MAKSEPVFRLKRILLVVWKRPIESARYVSHHEEHEDHEKKIHHFTLVSSCPSCPSWFYMSLELYHNRNYLLGINESKQSYCCFF